MYFQNVTSIFFLQECKPISENGCFASKGEGSSTSKSEITTTNNDITSDNNSIATEVVTTTRNTESATYNSTDINEISTDSSENEQSSSHSDQTMSTSENTIEVTSTPINIGDPINPNIICPPNFVGLIPDPDRCDKFYHCVVGQALPLYCAPGYEFDTTYSVSSSFYCLSFIFLINALWINLL